MTTAPPDFLASLDEPLAETAQPAAADQAAQAPGGHVHGPDCNHDHHHHHAPVRKIQRPGRNEPCHCGSGRKYKKCCLAIDGD